MSDIQVRMTNSDTQANEDRNSKGETRCLG